MSTDAEFLSVRRLAEYYTAGRVVGWSNEKVAEWELKRKRPRVSPRPLEG